jgi:hypothetical protein
MLSLFLLLNAHSRAAEPAAAPAASKTGAWIFKEVRIKKSLGTDRAAYFNHQLQVNTGAGIEHKASSHLDYWRGYGSKDTHRGSIESMHNWTVPPTQIAGDSEIALDLEAASTVKQTPDIDLGMPCRTHLYMYSREQGVAGANVGSTARQKSTHDKKTVKARVGKGGKANDELVINISAHAPSGSGIVDYVYWWDPTAPAVTSGGGKASPEPPPGTGTPPPGGSSGSPPSTPGGSITGPGSTTKEPADVSQMTIQAGTRTAKTGDTVIVPIWLIQGQGIANLNLNLKYNPAVAKATGTFAKGNLLTQSMFEANTGEGGIVRIGFAQNKDLAGPVTGTLAQISFAATGKPGDSTPLQVEPTTVSNAAGGKPAVAVIHGEIRIVGPDGVVPGDSDRDGKLTARDAQNALKMSVKLIPVDMVCDMDKDGQVTSTDARLILQKVVGK